jgi:uncharacterized RDD family membrane protein YckC
LASICDFLICLFLILITWLTITIVDFFTFGIVGKGAPFIVPITLISYYLFSLGSQKGITLGMSLFKVNLLDSKNQKLNIKQLLIYNLLFFLVMPIGIILLISIIFPLANKKRRCLQDYVLNTKFILID